MKTPFVQEPAAVSSSQRQRRRACLGSSGVL